MPDDRLASHWDVAEEAMIFRQAQAGDPQARQALVERHWNLIWHIVHRFVGRGYDPEDLFQVGAIGLLKAIDRFETDRGLKFSTYAVPLIMGEIRRHLRDDQPIRVARSVRELSMKVDQARAQLLQKLGREPSVNEIAAQLEMDVAEIVEAIDAARPIMSLNQPMESTGSSDTVLADSLKDQEHTEEDWLDHLALTQAFSELDERERYILRARYV
ncbi:MAG: sigma-70 family RNA polymerase sigma factor, partial [Firmicutes bacterium]|nr:sigma-70 family RNA polymerase sigma factor [Bacillota bacterium]